MEKQIIARGQITISAIDDPHVLDWIADWDSNKTLINSNTIITPKIFAGIKHPDDTLSGIALGHFALLISNDSGEQGIEMINGIYGFKKGEKTFCVDHSGNVQLGNSDEFIKYNSDTGKIEFGSAVSMQWAGATYIDKNGIFTGTIHADRITAGELNADRIAAGCITASKLDAESIKATLINVDYINGLILTFDKGTIGGWNINANSISKNSVELGADGSIINGNNWKLNADGSGALASGNITWDSDGNVTFSPDVNIDWDMSDLGEELNKYFTHIDANGIYTGTLTAEQINAVTINADRILTGTLSADRIAAGSIQADKLDVSSIQAEIINVEYLNGLSFTFEQGKIANWTIETGSIYQGVKNNEQGTFTDNAESMTIGSHGIRGYKWRFDVSGSGAIAGGNISWDEAGNVSLSSNVVISWDNISSVIGNKLTRIDSTGIYTGTLTANQVNAVSIDAGSIKTGTLNADRISTGSLNANKITSKSITAEQIAAGSITANEIKANTITGDKLNVNSVQASIVTASYVNGLYCTFTKGTIGSWTIGSDAIYSSSVYNNSGYFTLSNGAITIGTNGIRGFKWRLESNGSGALAGGNISWDTLGNVTFGASVSLSWSNISAAIGNKLTKIDANGIYTGTLTANQVNVYGLNASNISTGTLSSNRIRIDSSLTVGGSSYNGSINVYDASNNLVASLNRSGIYAISGRVGGWQLNDRMIYAYNDSYTRRIVMRYNGYFYNIACNSSGAETGNDYWALLPDGGATFGLGKIKFNADGSGFVANNNVHWDTSGNVTMTGTINATAGVIGGFTVSGNKLINKSTNTAIEFSTLTGTSSLFINSSTSVLLGMRVDSARTAISISTFATGARGIYVLGNAGTSYAIESYGSHLFGQRSTETWNAPGVLFSAIVKNSNTLYNQWGNGMRVTSFTRTTTGSFTCNHNLGHTNYTVITTPYWDSGTNWHSNAYVRVEVIAANSFKLRVVNADNGSLTDTCFSFAVIGRNNW